MTPYNNPVSELMQIKSQKDFIAIIKGIFSIFISFP